MKINVHVDDTKVALTNGDHGIMVITLDCGSENFSSILNDRPNKLFWRDGKIVTSEVSYNW